jgi:hypothetical protein
MNDQPIDATKRFEQPLEEAKTTKCILGQYQLEVIDIYQQPALAREAQIIATPTLIKLAPQPKKIMIGSFTHTERVLASLGLAQ